MLEAIASDPVTSFDRDLAAALGEERHAELVRLLTEAVPIVAAMGRGN
jgi:hypothetical protein